MSETTENQSNDNSSWDANVKYVGFYARTIATMIDTVALALPLGFVLSILFIAVLGEKPLPPELLAMQQNPPQTWQEVTRLLLGTLNESGALNRWLTENITAMVVTGGITIAFWYFFSATPGKMIMKMRIVDETTGMPPTPKQDAIRYAGYFLSILPLMLGFFWILWDKRKQGWHDKLAKTVVVYQSSLPPELAKLTQKQLDDQASTQQPGA